MATRCRFPCVSSQLTLDGVKRSKSRVRPVDGYIKEGEEYFDFELSLASNENRRTVSLSGRRMSRHTICPSYLRNDLERASTILVCAIGRAPQLAKMCAERLVKWSRKARGAITNHGSFMVLVLMAGGYLPAEQLYACVCLLIQTK